MMQSIKNIFFCQSGFALNKKRCIFAEYEMLIRFSINIFLITRGVDNESQYQCLRGTSVGV